VKRTLALCAVLAAGLAGCSVGSDDASPLEDDSDPRGATLRCLTDEKGLTAREQGDSELLVEDPRRGPRIVFYLTSGQAEAAQFEGDGEGSEQIGPALLFVRDGSDDLLEDVEDCLTD
jgi:hypothetical protein